MLTMTCCGSTLEPFDTHPSSARHGQAQTARADPLRRPSCLLFKKTAQRRERRAMLLFALQGNQ